MEDINPFEGINEVKQQTKATGKASKKQTTKEENKLMEDVKEVIKGDSSGNNQEKAKLIYAIQQYGKNQRLGIYLRQTCGHRYDEAYLKKLSVDELQLELEKQEVALANKQNNGIIDHTLKHGLLLAENVVSQKTSYDIKGTTDALYEDDHYLDLVERVKMKYNVPFLKLDPVLELALVIGQTAMLTHANNKYKTAMSENKVNLDKTIDDAELIE